MAVAGYSVYRGTSAGFTADATSLVGDSGTTAYTDPDVPVGTWYYRVAAYDHAENISPASDSIEVTVLEPVTLTVTAVEDTMVAQVNPANVYGASDQISARSPESGSTIESYLRFELPAAPAGLTLTGASLGVVTSNDPTADSDGAHQVSLLDAAWSEASTTWENRPTTGFGAQLGELTGATELNTAYVVELDAAPLADLVGHDVSLALRSTSTDNVRIRSKEHASTTTRPVLTLTYSQPEPAEPDTTHYTYNARGQLTQVVQNGQTQRAYTYDAFERLVAITGAGLPTTSYSYDSLDRPAQRNTANFGYIDLCNNPVLSPGGAGEATLLRDPTGTTIATRTGTGPGRLVLADPVHRDTTATINPATGTATASASYDPWGTPTASGTLPSGYQAGYTDPDTGLVNAHARWYDPTLAGFTTPDTWTLPPVPLPQANRYLYANANPLVGLDPTGHIPFLDAGGGGRGGGGGSGGTGITYGYGWPGTPVRPGQVVARGAAAVAASTGIVAIAEKAGDIECIKWPGTAGCGGGSTAGRDTATSEKPISTTDYGFWKSIESEKARTSEAPGSTPDVVRFEITLAKHPVALTSGLLAVALWMAGHFVN